MSSCALSTVGCIVNATLGAFGAGGGICARVGLTQSRPPIMAVIDRFIGSLFTERSPIADVLQIRRDGSFPLVTHWIRRQVSRLTV
jgi:hypothetical protein